MPVSTSTARFIDSDSLSKLKPLGILRLAPLGIILTTMMPVRVSRGEPTTCSRASFSFVQAFC
jgi:hypothetical protein